MHKTSLSIKISSIVTLLSVLLVQFALAFYVCPSLNTSIGKKPVGDLPSHHSSTAFTSSKAHATITLSSIVADNSTMPDCQGMDQEQASLCHAAVFDQQSKQSLDKPSPPDVQAFVVVGLVHALYSISSLLISFSTQKTYAFFALPKLAPITILHCCFRI